ncbi:hypothetical protein RFI_29143 [Reticulomyxa filosa]|uniref:Uncharacterized protein n=1 Tax=Reticulomyxa filosa TaxID=46433 RepID=X6M447_RETFI|nr:hypothetical protein RFI_29143 [Reticulomyxa filosa]|eukprot:ETO08247.1 hypothetical protein RFI_29143 [Reticulomyxa filosa]
MKKTRRRRKRKRKEKEKGEDDNKSTNTETSQNDSDWDTYNKSHSVNWLLVYFDREMYRGRVLDSPNETLQQMDAMLTHGIEIHAKTYRPFFYNRCMLEDNVILMVSCTQQQIFQWYQHNVSQRWLSFSATCVREIDTMLVWPPHCYEDRIDVLEMKPLQIDREVILKESNLCFDDRLMCVGFIDHTYLSSVFAPPCKHDSAMIHVAIAGVHCLLCPAHLERNSKTNKDKKMLLSQSFFEMISNSNIKSNSIDWCIIRELHSSHLFINRNACSVLHSNALLRDNAQEEQFVKSLLCQVDNYVTLCSSLVNVANTVEKALALYQHAPNSNSYDQQLFADWLDYNPSEGSDQVDEHNDSVEVKLDKKRNTKQTK